MGNGNTTKTLVTKKTEPGIQLEISFEKGYWTEEKHLDGWKTGYEKHLVNELSVKVNGKQVGTAKPTKIKTNDIWFRGKREKAYKNGAKYEISNGGCFGAYMSENGALNIIQMINEIEEKMNVELEEEIATVVRDLEIIEEEKKIKAEKNLKEIEEMEARDRASGLCPKCDSYCYGDCEAN